MVIRHEILLPINRIDKKNTRVFNIKKNNIELSRQINCTILKAKKLIMKWKCLTPEVFREQIFIG